MEEEKLAERLLVRTRQALKFGPDSDEASDGWKAHGELCARCKDPANKLSHIAKIGLYYLQIELKAIMEQTEGGPLPNYDHALCNNEFYTEDEHVREEEMVKKLKIRMRRVLTFPKGQVSTKMASGPALRLLPDAGIVQTIFLALR